jgi:hypothetical protein
MVLIALMMEAARTSETLVNFYQTTLCYNPEDSNLLLPYYTVLQPRRQQSSTITSTVIHASSCHPIEHGKTAFNYLLNRAEKYPLSSTNKKAELNIIKQIARENEYDNSILSKKTHKKQDRNPLDTPSIGNTQHDTKWATFTYIGKETKHITKLFKDTGIKITFRTNNSIKRILKPKPPLEQNDKYSSPGVYKLKCKDCLLQYIGQTGRSFATRYK